MRDHPSCNLKHQLLSRGCLSQTKIYSPMKMVDAKMESLNEKHPSKSRSQAPTPKPRMLEPEEHTFDNEDL